MGFSLSVLSFVLFFNLFCFYVMFEFNEVMILN